MTGRRAFLGGIVAAGIAAPLAAAEIAQTTAAEGADTPVAYAFEGAHQQGIVTPMPQAASAFVSYDVTATTRAELVTLFKTLTARIRFLVVGGEPVDLGLTAPASDTGILGPEVVPDGLTVTVSVGASLFDSRFGLAGRKPARLRAMDDFPNDEIDRSISDGDLLVQICADHADTVTHALLDLTRHTRGLMQPRWRQVGFGSPARPTGTARNLMGFKDGTANPDRGNSALMDELIWTHGGQGGEPAWVEGGSYHVVRVIEMLMEFWQRISQREQEQIFGRYRDTGAPLTGSKETDTPDYVADPTFEVIQRDAHIRLANPRTNDTVAHQQILRRSYNYDQGIDTNGNLHTGHLFVCFNQDLDRQFVTIQKRLLNEPLADYVLPVGGGYFFALPGVGTSDGWLGQGMLS